MPAPTAATANAGAAAGRLVAGAAASSPAPKQDRSGHKEAVHALRRGAPSHDDPERGEDAEGERQCPGRAHAQAEAPLGVEHEERGQRGVAEYPHRLSDEHLASARLARHLAQSCGGLVRLRVRGPLAEAQPARDEDGRHGRGGEHAGGESEGGRGGRLDQRAAEGDRDHGPDEPGDLLRARGGRPAAVLDVVRDDRAVCGRERVEPHVDERRRKAEHDVRGAVPEPDGHQAARGQHGPAGDVRKAAPTAIRPDPDRDRHAEAGDRVHHHHHADQRGGIVDPLEQNRQVGGREGPSRAGAHSRQGEREQQAPAAETCRDRGHAEPPGTPRAGARARRSRWRWLCRAAPRRQPAAAARRASRA